MSRIEEAEVSRAIVRLAGFWFPVFNLNRFIRPSIHVLIRSFARSLVHSFLLHVCVWFICFVVIVWFACGTDAVRVRQCSSGRRSDRDRWTFVGCVFGLLSMCVVGLWYVFFM